MFLFSLILLEIISNIYGDSRGSYNYTSINLLSHPGEECTRTCIVGDRRICYFHFVLEYYQAMGIACGNCSAGIEADCDNPQCIVGDGFEKDLLSINRQIPGPPIEVCLDDIIIVDLDNQAEGLGTTLHWHGINLPGEPFMDGVPFVTQCPIPFDTEFRYQFRASEAGTYFYHSHSALQMVNGVYGFLAIRQPPEEDPQRHLYDFDLPGHYLLISDWLHMQAEELYPGLPTGRQSYPDSSLINGRAIIISKVETHVRELNAPSRILFVDAKKRYRFRVVNSGSFTCPVQLQVESHRLNVIASDGRDLEPRYFDTLVINVGERYDFVLHANRTPQDYWIRARGLGVCNYTGAITEAFALLRYKIDGIEDFQKPRPPMPSYDDTYPIGERLNHPYAICLEESEDYCVTSLHSLMKDTHLRNAKPDLKYYLGFNNYDINISHAVQPNRYHRFANLKGIQPEIGAINNISLEYPNVPPLTQPHDLDRLQFCDQDHRPERCAKEQVCVCPHILKVPLNSLVEMIVIDEVHPIDNIDHSFHLHGYEFMLTDLGHRRRAEDEALEMEANGTLPRSPFNPQPPMKDTVSIPSGGFAIIRFRANNPGYWMFHCHFQWHLSMGMGLIVQVGDDNQMPLIPKNFPRCGNYLPDFRNYKSESETCEEEL